jgi:putative transposase
MRLTAFDYSSQCLYFVTACTADRRCILGDIVDDAMRLNAVGRFVRDQIEGLQSRLDVVVDAFVVMPNYVHVVVDLCVRARARRASPLQLGAVVGSFKSGSSREAGIPVWQRGYHDHIVRDEDDLEPIREYRATNPIRWALDPENPNRRP